MQVFCLFLSFLNRMVTFQVRLFSYLSEVMIEQTELLLHFLHILCVDAAFWEETEKWAVTVRACLLALEGWYCTDLTQHDFPWCLLCLMSERSAWLHLVPPTFLCDFVSDPYPHPAMFFFFALKILDLWSMWYCQLKKKIELGFRVRENSLEYEMILKYEHKK